jgi:hypothetical protein
MKTIRHCNNCHWGVWYEPNHKCMRCEPTGSGPSNFTPRKGTYIKSAITDKKYRKEKLNDDF